VGDGEGLGRGQESVPSVLWAEGEDRERVDAEPVSQVERVVDGRGETDDSNLGWLCRCEQAGDGEFELVVEEMKVIDDEEGKAHGVFVERRMGERVDDGCRMGDGDGAGRRRVLGKVGSVGEEREVDSMILLERVSETGGDLAGGVTAGGDDERSGGRFVAKGIPMKEGSGGEMSLMSSREGIEPERTRHECIEQTR
jgi:hypothetical protein